MKQYYETTAVQFLGLFNMFTAEGCSETRLVSYLINHVFRSL